MLKPTDRFDGYDTRDLWTKDRDHNIHPWTDFSVWREKGAMVVAEAEGAYIYDSEGNRYLDGIGGIWCVNIGYGREEMAAAVAEQIMRLTYANPFTDMTNAPAAKLTAKLAELSPGSLNHVFLSSGGSMANDTAIRIMHHYNNQRGLPDKKHVISRRGAYHGSTYLAMSLTGIEADHVGFDTITDWIHYLSIPKPYSRPDGMTMDQFCDHLIEEMEQMILEIGPEKVGAFIAEPIMGAGGVIVPPPGYHKKTYDLCQKYDMLYISDEVVTAFGRLGHFFASEAVFGIVPDMITCAKGLTSGYIPMGATLISDEIYDAISKPQAEGALFYHGFTYTGHPVGCAAALTNIQIMEDEQICEHVRRVGPYFEERLETLTDLPIVGEVRGSHFMLSIEFTRDKANRTPFDKTIGIADLVADACNDRGLIARSAGGVIVLSPPLILTTAQIDHMVHVLQEAITETFQNLTQQGIL